MQAKKLRNRRRHWISAARFEARSPVPCPVISVRVATSEKSSLRVPIAVPFDLASHAGGFVLDINSPSFDLYRAGRNEGLIAQAP